MYSVDELIKLTDFKYFFDLSPDLLCIADFNGYFKKVNASVSQVLGYSNEELLSKPIHEFIFKDDKESTDLHRNALKNGKPLLYFENRYVTKAGEIVWLSWTSFAVDELQCIYAIAKNVTHKKKLEDDRMQVIKNLTQNNNDLKLLTYTTSHDLRSPVNNLLAAFSLMNISKIEDEETLEYIDILKLATENLKGMLNNYSAILNEKNAVQVQTEELYFDDCLKVVFQSLSTLIQHSKADISSNFNEAEKVTFNRAFMESVFLNLLTNSIKYTKQGDCPTVCIYTRKTKGITQLIFEDEGLGFDMEKVKDKIFGFGEKFHNNTDSKGIGLYLVFNHVTSLGGNITVESKLNMGARFIISFKHQSLN